MNRKILLILFCIVASSNAFSQNTGNILGDSIQKVKIEEFKFSINKQFTKIATGTSFGNLGNFASVSSDSKSFTLGGSIISNQNIWAFEVAGGATEGIFKVFNNEELNSNFSGEIKYHRLTKIHFGARDAFEMANFDQQIIDLNNQFSKDSLAIVMHKDYFKIQSDIIVSNNTLNELKTQLFKIDSFLLIQTIARSTIDSLNAKRGLVLFSIQNEKVNNALLNKQLNLINKDVDGYFIEELEKKEEIRDRSWRDLIKQKKNADLKGFDITWISFGFRARNNAFKLFQPANVPSLQFNDTNFVSQRISASISRYRTTSFQGQDEYWTGGLFIDYTTNFNSLSKVEIEDRSPVAGNPQQEIKKTINAYQGSYKEGLFELTLFYDYYRFLGRFNSIVGIHINPSMNYNSTYKKPLMNIQLGIIVPFVEKEKQVSKINVEFFYSRQDLFNYLHKETKSSFWGIRATLPITIINYKQ